MERAPSGYDRAGSRGYIDAGGGGGRSDYRGGGESASGVGFGGGGGGGYVDNGQRGGRDDRAPRRDGTSGLDGDRYGGAGTGSGSGVGNLSARRGDGPSPPPTVATGGSYDPSTVGTVPSSARGGVSLTAGAPAPTIEALDDDIIFQGWLEKKSTKGITKLRPWRKRYFVMYRSSNEIRYFRNMVRRGGVPDAPASNSSHTHFHAHETHVFDAPLQCRLSGGAPRCSVHRSTCNRAAARAHVLTLWS